MLLSLKVLGIAEIQHQEPKFGPWTCSAGLAQNWFLVSIDFYLICFNWLIESTDRRKKGKEKEPRLFTKTQRAEEESHREARGDCLGRTRGRMGKGSGAAAGLVGLEGRGGLPRGLVKPL